MKQIVQNYKEGSLKIEEVPEPALKAGGVLVQSHHSLISAGTEKMKVDDSKRSYIGMAKARPEKLKQVIETFKQTGPLTTYRKVMNRLDSFTPLGYSLAGKVIEVCKGISGFQVGDLVACATANHAEINWVPVNLCCKIPEVSNGVIGHKNGFLPTEQAAFTTVGAIAMQGIRQAEVQVGENVAVIGLGLVGLISCVILKAAGCNVMGIDIDPSKVDLALEMGVNMAGTTDGVDVEQMALSFSGGYGVDAVLVTTGTESNEPIVMAGMIARDRATIVDVGINKMDIPWQLYFEKELVLKQSRSYGPGRYDPNYEIKGQDYPIGYVRWTEKRNMISFLDLIVNGRIDIRPLITHKFDFSRATEAYALIEGKKSAFYVGIILEYDTSVENLKKSRARTLHIKPVDSVKRVNIGMIGAGNFARTMLLPYLKGKDVNLAWISTATGISAKDAARKFGFDKCTTDYKELLKDDSINTIMIATRHNLHGKLVIESLKAGKHVYTEKPLCLTEEELKEIKLATDTHRHTQTFSSADPAEEKMSSLPRNGNTEEELKEISDTFDSEPGTRNQEPVLMVGFNRRFAPLIKEMKSFFNNRKEPMIMHYRVNAGYKEKNDWYQDKDIGGGRIIGEVCHFIDTYQYLTDALPVSVFAQTIKTGNHATTLEDNVIINLQFSDGSIGSITYLANGDPQFPKEYVEIFCENRVAVINNFSSLTTMANGKKRVKKAVIQDKGHKSEMKALVEAVKGYKPVPISFDSIYATTLACFKIHESIEKKQMIEISRR